MFTLQNGDLKESSTSAWRPDLWRSVRQRNSIRQRERARPARGGFNSRRTLPDATDTFPVTQTQIYWGPNKYTGNDATDKTAALQRDGDENEFLVLNVDVRIRHLSGTLFSVSKVSRRVLVNINIHHRHRPLHEG